MDDLQLLGKGRLADVYAWGDAQVIKLFATGREPALIEVEAQVSRIVHDAGIPCPAAHGIEAVDGRQGIVFDHVAGESMLARLSKKPWLLWYLGKKLADLHAAMHRISADGLPSQRINLEQQISRAEISATQRNLALSRLRDLPDGSAVCHGDFHPDNILIDGDKAVIIDWSTACVGNPVADFVLTSLLLQLGAPPSSYPLRTRVAMRIGRSLFCGQYKRHYRRPCSLSKRDVQPWLLPMVAARLGYSITAEREPLLRLLDRMALSV